MLLEKHISDLLYRYQCVTVPGFGAFLTETVSAHVTGSASSFFPPKKVISFNANVKNNDGLLANHVALQEKMSYELAVVKISEIVNEWTYLLQNRNRVVVKNVGEISVNNEMNWVFEPANTVNYLTDSFGLSSFISPEITREVLKKEVEALEEKAPIVFTPERKKDYSYLKYAAVFVVMFGAIGGVGFGYKMYNDQQIETKTLAVQKNVQEKVQQQIQEATFLISTPVNAVELTVATPVEEKMPYHLIAGAYRSEENANKAIAELKSEGFESAKMLPLNKHNLFPVVYASYKTLEEAQLERKNIQKTHNAEAWLMIE
ncbi:MULTISPECIES: SPOR domain-containing protein [unclassified Flavobacterium]|uniref:HU domain-containing protein n=1 Tax=unclassified Flavobacterium TaxID=196869 RepID=UPI0012916A98|nr:MULTISPECIES: SPOR domain-containing protein [unclassified Flavobacterium]MQP51500.1 SPOR domain-containing protein [Flavobacterium sp. LMO9]MQP61272.1 SPOR domain-containing protein [Flavobacterium sp. LMO6]